MLDTETYPQLLYHRPISTMVNQRSPDRFLEITGTVSKDRMQEQILDSMDLGARTRHYHQVPPRPDDLRGA